MHRRRKIAGHKPSRAKPSPAIIPPTPDAPIHLSAPSTSAPKASKMAEALAKDAMPATNPVRDPKKVTFGGKAVEIAAGAVSAARWKKKVDALFHLDGLQEVASNHVTSDMSSFVQRTSVVKEVCISSSPRAQWRISIDNPLWCSKRNYL
jgi:hypothetical protein